MYVNRLLNEAALSLSLSTNRSNCSLKLSLNHRQALLAQYSSSLMLMIWREPKIWWFYVMEDSISRLWSCFMLFCIVGCQERCRWVFWLLHWFCWLPSSLVWVGLFMCSPFSWLSSLIPLFVCGLAGGASPGCSLLMITIIKKKVQE